jgi:hypothetical protein
VLYQCEYPTLLIGYLHLQYYAALADWRSGSSKPVDFTANAYQDVYLGHISTLQHIEDTRKQAFHRMLADIYERARYVNCFLSSLISDMAQLWSSEHGASAQRCKG